MVSYNPEDWLRFLFRFHRADTFRKLWPLLAVVAFYAGLLAFLELSFLPAASAASQESVELCVLTTSQRFDLNQSRSALTPFGRFFAMGNATTGTPQLAASL